MDPFGDRGETVGVYCIAKTNDGDVLVDLMNIEELKKIQSCAKTQMVWTQWPDEMAKKAIIKRASKQWPKTDQSSQLHKAVEVINETEGGTDPFAELENIADEVLQLLNLPEPDLSGVGQIWSELTQKECDTLWTAKTKGGWFSTKEKELIRQAGFEYHKSNITA
jgi:recombination protein RecT